MWRTSCGQRTLHGAEARLSAEALLSLLDEAHTDDLPVELRQQIRKMVDKN